MYNLYKQKVKQTKFVDIAYFEICLMTFRNISLILLFVLLSREDSTYINVIILILKKAHILIVIYVYSKTSCLNHFSSLHSLDLQIILYFPIALGRECSQGGDYARFTKIKHVQPQW